MIFKLKVNIPDHLTDADDYYFLREALTSVLDDLAFLDEWPPTADIKHRSNHRNYKWSLTLGD